MGTVTSNRKGDARLGTKLYFYGRLFLPTSVTLLTVYLYSPSGFISDTLPYSLVPLARV
jgi:hypothetical protein